MKPVLAICMSLLLLCGVIPTIPVGAAPETVSFSVNVKGVDTAVGASAPIVVFPNTDKKERVIPSDQYNFRNAYLLIFDANGLLIEAGSRLVANTDGTFGAPQTSVTVPAGGFMVAFGENASNDLMQCYRTAFEDAVLYNATMSIIYEVHAEYNAASKTVSVRYPAPVPESKDAIRFLFVGNSCTYFNGTPIKFKGLCRAAGLDVSVTYCTFGSAYLREFADETHERGKALRRILSEKKFDYVVLQDASMIPYQIDDALKVILPLVEKNGATPLLYMRYSNTVEGAVNQYKAYTAVGKQHGITVAPSAVAVRYCMQEKPSIPMLADDNAHHSREGSYLIACTWLRTFLGVSPVGNKYTANLDGATVDYLQKVALRACDTPFTPDELLPAVYRENGTEYYNLALEKPYTSTGDRYNGNWTDTGADGKPLGKLTDGESAPDGGSTYCGCYCANVTDVVVDLGSVCEIKRVTADLFGNDGWGIPSPSDATVTFSVSTDGKNYTVLGETKQAERSMQGSWECVLYAATAKDTVPAQYVKVTYKLNNSQTPKRGDYCWVSEINAFGLSDEEPAPGPGDDPNPGDDPGDTSDPATSEPEVSEPEVSEPAVSEPETSETESDASAQPTESEADPSTENSEASETSEAVASTSNTPSEAEPESKGFPVGAVVGILAAIAAVAAGVIFFVKRKK